MQQWSRQGTTFLRMLVCCADARVPQFVISSAMLTLGKMSYYMSADNPYFDAVKNLLFDLNK
jgi:hypothetical protein